MAKGSVADLNFLDALGVNTPSGTAEFTSVDEVMLKYATLFINKATKTINSKNKVDTGKMSDIEVSSINFLNGKWSMTIGYDKNNPASKYYDYQNKGVKGIKSGVPNSQYSFRTLSVSAKMVEAIMAWYLRHRNYIRKETQKRGLSKLQKKRKKLSADSFKNNLRAVATNTAKKIKERGIKRVGFFEDNMDVFGKEFQQEVAQALGKNIVVSIKQVIESGNNGNNNK
jgi:hypothetical protein